MKDYSTSILLGNGEVITKHYNTKNQLHREGGPAVETAYQREWWVDGKQHRVNGPAVMIERNDYIRMEWWVNGVLHRENNKPAVIDSDGTLEYWVNGVHKN